MLLGEQSGCNKDGGIEWVLPSLSLKALTWVDPVMIRKTMDDVYKYARSGCTNEYKTELQEDSDHVNESKRKRIYSSLSTVSTISPRMFHFSKYTIE